jgi:UDP-N-acetylmuramoyl-L-alanyl-D-glutamate--2,6-diaminopimelate ligase
MSALKSLLKTLGILPLYHLCLAHAGAVLYGFPSNNIIVVGVTGTKGKSSTTEMLNSIFEAAGYKTALLNSIRIKIDAHSTPNTMRMSMPGRFYIQRFLSRAARARCGIAILEMTSEGARQHRHRAISLDGLIFTNLAPEHIESHGSYEAYANAKFSIGTALAHSSKRPRIIVANAEDAQGARYLALPVETKIGFTLSNHNPHESSDHGGYFTLENARISTHLPGDFSLKNALAAALMARALGLSLDAIQTGLGSLEKIPGRAERVDAGQPFTVIVDYAHTADSLEALYAAYPMRKICVLGSTGGGRDTWKRPVMGEMADRYCDHIIVTNEDPYDEDPKTIIDAVASGIKKHTPEIITDRREAISKAFEIALSWSKGAPLDTTRGDQNGIAVLITGKGTDPNIAGPRGTKTPWSDAAVAKEELQKLNVHTSV